MIRSKILFLRYTELSGRTTNAIEKKRGALIRNDPINGFAYTQSIMTMFLFDQLGSLVNSSDLYFHWI